MSRCPKCDAEISHLVEYSEAETRYCFFLDEQGQPSWQFRGYIDDDFPVIEYQCPICEQVVCNDRVVAVALLRGEEIAPVEESVLAEEGGESLASRHGEVRAIRFFCSGCSRELWTGRSARALWEAIKCLPWWELEYSLVCSSCKMKLLYLGRA